MPQIIPPRHDSDVKKGAFETELPPRNANDESNTSLSGQMGHRNQPEEAQGEDTDFPEPDAQGEHSGQ